VENMDKVQFDALLKEIKIGLEAKKAEMQDVLIKERSKGISTKTDKILDVITDFEFQRDFTPQKESIAVCYLGNPEVTLTYILDSLARDNKITLCANEGKAVNEILINIVLAGMRKLKMKNQWINYNPNHNEIYLRDNEKYFSKIVYIGDFFEFDRFKSFFKKKPVEYNNYGHIKLFIDKVKYAEEFKKITQFTYTENISLEVFTDIDDFIYESKKEDYAVLYIDDVKMLNKVQQELKSGEVIMNDFPFDTYKFKISK
jgi:hypothetical protein